MRWDDDELFDSECLRARTGEIDPGRGGSGRGDVGGEAREAGVGDRGRSRLTLPKPLGDRSWIRPTLLG
jgi:hypothetical protein